MGWRRTPKKEDNDEVKEVVKAIRSGTQAEAVKKLSDLLDKVYNRAVAQSAGRYEPHEFF